MQEYQSEFPLSSIFDLVFVACEQESEHLSIDLAQRIHDSDSELSDLSFVNYQYELDRFLNEPGLPDDLRNLHEFFEVCRIKFLNPGTTTIVANTSLIDVNTIIDHLQPHKPDLKILLIVTEDQRADPSLTHRESCITCCVSEWEITPQIREMLRLVD